MNYSSAPSNRLVLTAAAEELQPLSARDVCLLTRQIYYNCCVVNVSDLYEICSTFVVKGEPSNERTLCT